jgi:hypothetical protein
LTVKSKTLIEGGFVKDLACTDFEAASLALRKSKLALRDVSKITHVIIHTTGVNIYRRLDRDEMKPLGLAKGVAWTYQNIMEASAHFVVASDGIGQTNPVKYRAQHVGSKDGRFYRPIKDKYMPLWWIKEARDNDSLRLSATRAWRTGSVNEVSVGIEILPPRARKNHFDVPTIVNLRKLLADLLDRLPNVEYVTTHARVCPTSRTAKDKPWDLFEHLWNQVRSECRDIVDQSGARGLSPILA